MLPSLVLALREGVEAALIVGMLLGVLRKLQREDLSSSVWWGLISALIVSALVAAGLTIAGKELEGPAEPVFEGFMMLAAASLLTWMIFWMHRQSRFLRGKIEQDVRLALGANDREQERSSRAMFGVSFLAVVREGIELALFLAAAGLASNPLQELSGAVLGLLAATALGWLLFSSTRRLPLSRFFTVTNVLLIFFAAGLVAHGVGELNEVGWIPSVIGHIYDLNPFLAEASTLGQLLSAIAGYSASPSLTEAAAYLVYFAILLLAVFRLQRATPPSAAQGKAA